MIAFVGEEWRGACSFVGSIIVSKLGKGKKRRPVILLVITVTT
jgi:hypothetical protein